jgi:hypothetical protein
MDAGVRVNTMNTIQRGGSFLDLIYEWYMSSSSAKRLMANDTATTRNTHPSRTSTYAV